MMRLALVLLLATVACAIVIPDGYVAVPGSRLQHRSCVHEVASGSMVRNNPDGSYTVQTREAGAYRVPACKHPEIRLKTRGKLAKGQAPQECGSWIVDTIQTTQDSNGYSYMSSNFVVPSPPKSDPSTLLYLFPALCDAASDNIIQPVLQWGSGPGGGGAEWIYESWFVGGSSSMFSQLLGPLEPQTPLFGFMQYNPANASWLISSIDSTTGEHTDLYMPFNTTTPQPNAYITLEMYSETDCGNLPPENGITFADIVIKDWSGNAVPLTMNPDGTRCSDCSFNSTIDDEDSSVRLTWVAV